MNDNFGPIFAFLRCSIDCNGNSDNNNNNNNNNSSSSSSSGSSNDNNNNNEDDMIMMRMIYLKEHSYIVALRLLSIN